MFAGFPALSLHCRKLVWANLPRKHRETHKPDRGSSRPRDLTLSGGKMIVLSRSFIRKRVISLATTASVAATSLALAHGPTRAYRIHQTMPIQYVADWHDNSNET